ncbi:dihydropteroate synthase [Gilliamella sp. W8145]|uniref:dihydropteroate synthase n=1 Tax=unclassified Gilliamella TaxID=2685620 RepID=UPI0018DEAE05|nr:MULTISPECIES: dihydropteroate synthase [unclassified Gilliamella]MBI0038883.1 dihydropteroate synthase [Gilliamella sp. B14384G10]MBI0041166.1 dihydropteroate synthase [Gilliamella sp. B14384G7]MBI0052875.1 dihydropteroate synthase [Gilliamella sp. B14384G13]MBI0055170.1 dihydropteroate synthase [Gilliamella sp. B14384H2]MBI0104508.1 dihydropteroate synthase [Gilliamella sp. W8145]
MEIRFQNHVMDLSFPQVMGIVNMTPDSFSDGGNYNNLDDAMRRVDNMIQAGATFIDVGGESTRSGAADVSTSEELDRVIPLVEKIARYFDVWISVDTSKPEVITEAAKAGAHLINDIRALTLPGALQAAQKTELPVCIMHMQGDPKTMQNAPHYQQDIYQEVDSFFTEHIQRCVTAGIAREKIILDPGFGFGKTLAHNYRLLATLEKFHHFNLPILVGMSRKSMVGQVLNVPPKERVLGSVSCAVIAAMKGAQIIRVHDVKETFDAMRIVQATLAEQSF